MTGPQRHLMPLPPSPWPGELCASALLHYQTCRMRHNDCLQAVSDASYILLYVAVCLCRIVTGDNIFLTDLEGVHERLKERGAGDDLCGFVEDLLVKQHQRYHNFMTAESDKRRLLLEHLHKLEVRPLVIQG